jgi:hypothetical protein
VIAPMFALGKVVDFFTNKLPRLGRRRLTLACIFAGSLSRFLVGRESSLCYF